MGKYTSVRRQAPPPRNKDVHPIMRGIGCIMIIIVPIFAYGVAVLLVDYGTTQGWPVPAEWLGTPTIPPLLWELQGLRPILGFIQAQPNLEAYLIFTLVVTLVITFILIVIYGYIYTLFGPSRYGPQDAPPIKGRKIKPYKR